MHKNRKKKYIVIAVLFLFLIVGIFLATKLATVASILFQVATSNKIDLKKEDDHVNILLLGIGGVHHDGPDLTDTMLFASVDTKNNKITLVSIPRDLWEPDLAGANKKINGAYTQGEDKKPGGGLIETKSIVAKVIGQPIDYGVVIDFSGFVKTVDLLGGIDVTVDRTFDDYEYPIDGKEDIQAFTATDSAELDLAQYFSCRYIHVHFDKGFAHMDGQTALEFVRSRHALGIEGTDFARSQRQEKVIKAIKDKAFSLNIILNPSKVLDLYNTVKSSIDTDIPTSQFDDFIKLAQKMKDAKIQTAVIDTGDVQTNRAGLLIQAPTSSYYDYLYALIPKAGNGNFSQIKKYVSCEIAGGNCDTPINLTPTRLPK